MSPEYIQKLTDVYTQYQHFDLSSTILNSKVLDVQNKEASLKDRTYLNDKTFLNPLNTINITIITGAQTCEGE